MKIAALFSPKLKLFVNGRKNVFTYLKNNLADKPKIIWVHTASLGEFEQGLPVIERLKTNYPNYKILVTFFSPSGYEVKKNTGAADFVTYLPLDTKKNAKEFIKITKPDLVIFVKYEIWPNYLAILKVENIPTILISALFNKKQLFFKNYGHFMRKSLSTFTHFFVQNDDSKLLLNSINLKNVSIAGDTRFDRVLEILQRDNHLNFMKKFKQENKCLVAGSTWPDDETILIDFINTSSAPLKYVIAPHTIKKEAINKLKATINKKTIIYSEIGNQDLSDFDVILIDTIGILTKIYSYADLAYVGGGFVTGLHNTLEPAVFGIPVLIGPNYSGFKEAEYLVAKKGILIVKDSTTLNHEITRLINDSIHYKTTAEININYIAQNAGASEKIIQFISNIL